MKYYSHSVIRNMSYELAVQAMDKGCVVSREEWDGVHLKYNNDYIIILKTGEIIINPEELYCTDKKDWCIVMPTKEIKKILEEKYKAKS